MTQKERMLKELPYKAWLDGLAEERLENKKRIYRYNLLPPEADEERDGLIREIFGKTGALIHVEAPFYCDYGYNLEAGENLYINYHCVILDVAKVVIGNDVMFGPNVAVYTAGHPIHPEMRKTGYEYGIGITIGNNVWVGGNSVINPGVHIGNNAVIGSGSVVTKDIPENAVAGGNPCRLIRFITEADKAFYYKDRSFDFQHGFLGDRVCE